MANLILYTTDDGRSKILLRADLGTVWLTQLEMAELFDATKQNISLHLKKLFKDGELDVSSVVKDSLTTQFATRCVAHASFRIFLATAEERSVVDMRKCRSATP